MKKKKKKKGVRRVSIFIIVYNNHIFNYTYHLENYNYIQNGEIKELKMLIFFFF